MTGKKTKGIKKVQFLLVGNSSIYKGERERERVCERKKKKKPWDVVHDYLGAVAK